MADQQQRHAEPPLQGFEQQQNLALYGDVECGGGFVGDQQFRLAGQGHRDHHPLTLATGQLMRVGLEAFLGFLDAHQVQQLKNPCLRRFAGHASVHQQGFADLLFDAVERIEGGHRLLENHRDAVTAQFTQLAGIGADQFLAAIADAAGGFSATFGQQLQDRMGGHRFARARFAHQCQAFAAADIQAQIAHHGLATEGHAEVTDFDQVGHINIRIKIVDQDRGSKASRKASPMNTSKERINARVKNAVRPSHGACRFCLP
ncbi:hypothetical protein D3C72_367850 [compost metagenome]